MSPLGGFLLVIAACAAAPLKLYAQSSSRERTLGTASDISRHVDDNGAVNSLAVAIEEVQLGFHGAYKVGHWTPLQVQLRSQANEVLRGNLAVQVLDGDGILTTIRQSDVVLPAGARVFVKIVVKPGRPRGTLRVVFESHDQLAERVFEEDELPEALLATQELIVEVGESIGVARLSQQYRASMVENTTVATIDDPSNLPVDVRGYDGVDRVVLSTSDADELGKWDQKCAEALELWLQEGGRLLLSLGRSGGKLEPDQSNIGARLLRRLAPGNFERVAERGPGPWETFAGALAEPMQSPEGGGASTIVTTVLRGVRGETELADGEIPLVVRALYGFGEVLFVAADLDRPPIAGWSARGKLLLRLLGWKEHNTKEIDAASESIQGMRLGYTDLSGQLRAALGQFNGVAVVPFWLVFLLALGYIALLFPMEFVVVRWLRPRFALAWLLLPLVLLASASGVWYIALRWKGRDTLVKQTELVDVDLESGLIHGRVWLGMYSPQNDAYSLDIGMARNGGKASGEASLSWLGLAGTGLGGMNSKMAAPEQFDAGYLIENGGSVKEVPMAAWSSKAFEADWSATATRRPAALGERGTDHQPLGIIENESGVSLTHCVVLYEGWAYDIGELLPGRGVDLGRVHRLQTIHSYLTGRHTVGDKEQATPYDPEGADLIRILRAITFHDAAGGRQYTALSNRVYNSLDWTEQLRLGRAVLVATGPPSARVNVRGMRGDEVLWEDAPAVYRFVIPVNREGQEGRGPTVTLRLE